MSREIPLTKGKVAIVDDGDFERVDRHKWCAVTGPWGLWYAKTNIRVGDRQKLLGMHRLILGLSFGDKLEVDHRDGDGLNNTRNNIRVCTHSDNMKNQRPTGRSQFKGVSWSSQRKCWKTSIWVGGKSKYIGITKDEKQAALMYDLAALRYHREYARCNLMENLIGR